MFRPRTTTIFRYREKFSQNFPTRHRKTFLSIKMSIRGFSRRQWFNQSWLYLQMANIGIILNFNQQRFFNFFKAYVTSRCCVHEIWSLTRDKQFICRSLLLLKKKQTKKSISLSHFSNLLQIFITADVLNSACFDSISFCEKLKLTFNSFPLGLQCSQILTSQNG